MFLLTYSLLSGVTEFLMDFYEELFISFQETLGGVKISSQRAIAVRKRGFFKFLHF